MKESREEITFPFKGKNVDLELLFQKMEKTIRKNYGDVKTKVYSSGTHVILAKKTPFFEKYRSFAVVQVAMKGNPNDFSIKILIDKLPRFDIIPGTYGMMSDIRRVENRLKRTKFLKRIEELVYSLENSKKI